MTRLIDADALSKKLCETTIFVKGGAMLQRMINDAPTIEPDGDTISRSQAIKDVSEWATDILHQDRLVKEDAIHILESLPSAEQITGKLNNPDDSLLTADSEACKEQKSKLDLISRQAVIELIKNSYYNLAENMDDVWAMVHDVEQLPSAPDSRQRGEWVRKYDGHINCYWYECDQCGEYRPRNQFGHEYNANFCPNCGARMYKGGEDDADE